VRCRCGESNARASANAVQWAREPLRTRERERRERGMRRMQRRGSRESREESASLGTLPLFPVSCASSSSCCACPCAPRPVPSCRAACLCLYRRQWSCTHAICGWPQTRVHAHDRRCSVCCVAVRILNGRLERPWLVGRACLKLSSARDWRRNDKQIGQA
jgi:hypothetical protein